MKRSVITITATSAIQNDLATIYNTISCGVKNAFPIFTTNNESIIIKHENPEVKPRPTSGHCKKTLRSAVLTCKISSLLDQQAAQQAAQLSCRDVRKAKKRTARMFHFETTEMIIGLRRVYNRYSEK
jgi:hypothetical protein